jgi:type IX secretion system PorP/SprF family membrane protein
MKNIIRITGFILLTVIIKSSIAQQLPLNNLYNQYRYLYNPAYAGENGYTEAFLSSRNQWTSIEGAPSTSVFGLHKPWGENVGLGVIFIKDKVQFLEKLTGSFTYSYKVFFNKEKNHKFTFGLSAGFLENKLDFSGVRADLTDPVLISGKYDGFQVDACIGFRYNIRDFELGFAFPQLLSNNINYSRNGFDDFDFNFTNHFVGLASYRFKIFSYDYDENNNRIKSATKYTLVEPSVFYRAAVNTPWQLDLNLTIRNYREQWLAVTYRPNNAAFVMSGGFMVFDKISLGYAYEFTNSKLSDYSNGTHEIIIAYRLLKKCQKEEMKKEGGVSQEMMQALSKNQAQLMAKIDSLKNEIRKINESCCAGKKELEDMLKRQTDLQNQIDSLRYKLGGIKTGQVVIKEVQPVVIDTAKAKTIVTPVVTTVGEDVEKLRKELEELKKYVQEIKDKNVVVMKPVPGEGEGKETKYEEKEIERGCYVIVHSLRDFEKAKRAVKITKEEKGLDANIIYNKDRGWYYIYTDKYDSLQPALERMREIRKSYYPDSWVHIYKMSMGK